MSPVDKAFNKIRRKDFLPPDQLSSAGLDIPLPIGCGQTISQPSTVRMMLEWLEVEPGNKILDVGSGSGWTTALLSSLTGAKGKVYAVERVPRLLDFGKRNCANSGILNAKFFPAGKYYGLPRFAPYDRILVSAAAGEIPGELIEQLSNGGKMVIPVKNDVLEIVKTAGGQIEKSGHPGFVFVPLI